MAYHCNKVLIILMISIALAVELNKSNNAGTILKFLQSIPKKANEEMNSILHDTNLTKAQLEQKLDAWASKQPGDFPVRSYYPINSL